MAAALSQPLARPDATATASALRAYLGRHAGVWVWEEGRRLGQLAGEAAGYSLSAEPGRLVCHLWTAELNLVRRVVEVRAEGTRLRLRCQRLGQPRPTTLVLEAGTEAGAWAERGAARAEFHATLAAAAAREWPGWTAVGSPNPRTPVQRLVLQRGAAVVVMAAVEEAEAAGPALAQALSWAAAVKPGTVLAGIRVVAPAEAAPELIRRRRWLRADVPVGVYRLDRSAGLLERMECDGQCGPAAVLGRAPAIHSSRAPEPVRALLAEMRRWCPQVLLEASPEGWKFRLYGLEVARQAQGAEAGEAPFVFGCGREQSPLLPENWALFERFLQELGEQRAPGGERSSPWYAAQPERWMECLLRADPAVLEASCDPRFWYTQVPSWGAERAVLDLLGVDRKGRLVVVELKAAEEREFALQGLDYWSRVREHQQAGDFERLGYFPGVKLSPAAPRLWLVAPGLRWHPDSNAVLRWLAPEVPWTCLGINEQWRQGIQVIHRKAARGDCPSSAAENSL